MGQILIFILKLIGWGLLGILGLVLGVLLLVLFSAICYRIDGKKEDSLWGKLYLSWFFRILSVAVVYEKGLFVQVKLFGKTLYKLDNQEDEQSQKQEETLSEADRESFSDKNQEEVRKETGGESSSGRNQEKIGKETGGESSSGRNQEEIRKETEREKRLQEELRALERERAQALSGKGKQPQRNKASKAAMEEEAVNKGLWERIEEKIAAGIEKLKFAFSEICGKLKQIEEKRQWLLQQWDRLLAMLKDQENQKSARLILRQVKKMFSHILPRKGMIFLRFGREDPYLMGKIVSYASAAYPFTHKFLTFYPVFGQDKLEGEVHIRGHIRLGVVIGYVLRLLFNQNIRRKLLSFLHKKKGR